MKPNNCSHYHMEIMGLSVVKERKCSVKVLILQPGIVYLMVVVAMIFFHHSVSNFEGC